jgi:hypothetical protein
MAISVAAVTTLSSISISIMAISSQVVSCICLLLAVSYSIAGDSHGSSSSHDSAHDSHGHGHGVMLMHFLRDIVYPYLEEGVVVCNFIAGFLIVAGLAQSVINLVIMTSNHSTGKRISMLR